MTIQKFLEKNIGKLKQSEITTARLDCLVLLTDELNTNSAHILSHLDTSLSILQLERLDAQISRRITHEPLAYIRKKCEFYGHNFYIDHCVLVPRPESEAIIDLLKSLQKRPNLTMIDIGTGSGALAITAKIEFPYARVIATDIDNDCISVASLNASQLHVSIEFFTGSLLNVFTDQPYGSLVFMCNLPYVPDNFPINRAAKHEPGLALFGGHDGLDIYRDLFIQMHGIATNESISILTESLPSQHSTLEAVARNSGFTLKKSLDFVQLFERI